jgi:hypothetical protein
MFKNFKNQGPADNVLVYLTVFIQHCLRDIGLIRGTRDKAAAEKVVATLVKEQIPNFDDEKFFMSPLLDSSKPNDVTKAKKYLMDVKEECAKRLLEILWHPEHGDIDLKFWLVFGKKNFVGYKFNNKIGL